MSRYVVVTVGLLCAALADAQVSLTRGTNFAVDVTADGRLSFDLHGKVWTIPAGGGSATVVPQAPPGARRPQFSPDGNALVFQARDGNQESIWLYRRDAAAPERISAGDYYDHHPDWHPDAERIVYSSDRRDSGFDIWELDLATGLTWRLTSLPGDESEPAWSADGEDLVYIHRDNGRWSLMLRRRGKPDEVLETSSERLSSPSWRSDGSLVTFLRHSPDGYTFDMAILSDPVLVRPLLQGEDFFIAPLAWRDRQRLLYAANGQIRRRAFNSWTSRDVPFRATIVPEERPRYVAPSGRELIDVGEPGSELVVRVGRLFDGLGGGYRDNVDIVMAGGRIVAVEPHGERPGAIVVDMKDLTALPGFIDADARLPDDAGPALGPLLLSFGVTTVVTDNAAAIALNERWAGKDMPGPRVLGPDWRPSLDTVATMALDAAPLSTSPQGVRYENGRLSDAAEPVPIFSGLADSRTRGLAELLTSRQARLTRGQPTAMRRFIDAPPLAAHSSSVVLGSRANGLAPGVATHAELLALRDAGLGPEQVLRAAGSVAASVLGVPLATGRVAVGASADIVLVDGDPLVNIEAVRNIVGVVRYGRFFSVIGLIERVESARAVE